MRTRNLHLEGPSQPYDVHRIVNSDHCFRCVKEGFATAALSGEQYLYSFRVMGEPMCSPHMAIDLGATEEAA